MELQEFIKQSLVSIVKGVTDAANELSESDAVVSPGGIESLPGTSKGSDLGTYNPHSRHNHRHVYPVEFDVAVFATEGTEKKGGIGVVVGGIGLGKQNTTDSSNSSQSRIKFCVPLVLPDGEKRNK